MARVTKFTQKMADKICNLIVDGKSMRQICKPSNMPAKSTVFKWLNDNKDFSDQYARAKKAQAEALADEIIEIADTATSENANAVRIMVDARKWNAAKLLPKKYGDKIDVEVTHTVSDKMAKAQERAKRAERKNGE